MPREIFRPERVAFIEEVDADHMMRLTVRGDITEAMLDGLARFIKRQRARLRGREPQDRSRVTIGASDE